VPAQVIRQISRRHQLERNQTKLGTFSPLASFSAASTAPVPWAGRSENDGRLRSPAISHGKREIVKATVFQNAPAQGTGAVDAALKLAKGENVPSFVWVPFELVTPGNLTNYLAGTEQSWAAWPPTRRMAACWK